MFLQPYEYIMRVEWLRLAHEVMQRNLQAVSEIPTSHESQKEECVRFLELLLRDVLKPSGFDYT
ncbi:MAG: hypothetical protein AAGJ35_15910, partial [Myxococcota bacterium]